MKSEGLHRALSPVVYIYVVYIVLTINTQYQVVFNSDHKNIHKIVNKIGNFETYVTPFECHPNQAKVLQSISPLHLRPIVSDLGFE